MSNLRKSISIVVISVLMVIVIGAIGIGINESMRKENVVTDDNVAKGQRIERESSSLKFLLSEDETEETTSELVAEIEEETTTEEVTEEVTTEPITEAVTESVTEETTAVEIEYRTESTYDIQIELGTYIVTQSGEPVTTQSEEDKRNKRIEMDKTEYYYTPDKELHQEKIQWLRNKYGDKFTCNGKEFVYDDYYSDFVVYEKRGNIHYMTSPSTSTIGYWYYKIRYYRVAEYLGYYGAEHPLYNNEEAFNYKYWIDSDIDEGRTVENAEGNNEAYLISLGWEKSSTEILDNWEFMSKEGVPVAVYESGYLNLYIMYPGSGDIEECRMTIEEYNEFINKYDFRVGEQTRHHTVAGMDWGKSSYKYVVVLGEKAAAE